MSQAEGRSPERGVSVIIPVYGGGRNFRRCLAALSRTQPPPGEIVVVSDGDGEETGALAAAEGAVLVGLPGPRGPARARNAGARKAAGEILLFLDADVVVPPEIIGRVAAAFACAPTLAALFGSYDDEPGASNFLSQYKNLLHHYIHQRAQEEASTFWGACGAIRKEIFLAMGGFRESYERPSVEDIELGYRLKKAGHEVRLLRSMQVKHLKRWTGKSLLESDFFCRAVPWTQLILKERMWINDLNLSLANRISVILAFFVLGSLSAVPWWPGSAIFSAVSALFLLLVNAPLYRWFLRKRGVGFTAMAIPWHWFSFLYSGVAFAVGLVIFLQQRGEEPARVLPEGS